MRQVKPTGEERNEATPLGEKFPRWCRLIHQRDFQIAFREGRRVSVSGFKIVVRDNGLGYPRLGLAVSRKVGNAIVRNKMKRRLREIFRRQRQRFPFPADIVVIPYRGSADLSFEQLQSTVLGAIESGCGRVFPRRDVK